MFEFSWPEMLVVALVALLVVGPEELPSVIRNCKKIITKIKSVAKEFTDSITEIDEIKDIKSEAKKLNDDLKVMIDLEGNKQQTYDISDIMVENKAKKGED
jgi:sec-independent protein translocase protein TatB